MVGVRAPADGLIPNEPESVEHESNPDGGPATRPGSFDAVWFDTLHGRRCVGVSLLEHPVGTNDGSCGRAFWLFWAW